jgi:starch synthase
MPFYGEKLDGLLRSKTEKLYGILNGLDYEEFDPESDENITKKYSVQNFRTEKWKNKLALQKKLGLAENKNIFMIALVSRLTDQKGLDLIKGVFEEMCNSNLQFVVLGTGIRNMKICLNIMPG